DTGINQRDDRITLNGCWMQLAIDKARRPVCPSALPIKFQYSSPRYLVATQDCSIWPYGNTYPKIVSIRVQGNLIIADATALKKNKLRFAALPHSDKTSRSSELLACLAYLDWLIVLENIVDLPDGIYNFCTIGFRCYDIALLMRHKYHEVVCTIKIDPFGF